MQCCEIVLPKESDVDAKLHANQNAKAGLPKPQRVTAETMKPQK